MSMYAATGRRISKDDSDHKYLLPRRREAAAVTSRYWWTPQAYDQGESSQCVAYSGMRYLTSNPVVNVPFSFRDLYVDCLHNDEWPGEDMDGGTSVRALFKVLQRRGYVSEYRWAFEVEPVIDHLLTRGPVVVGTLWTPAMANIRDDGYVLVGRSLRTQDGHAWCLIGANRRRVNPDKTLGAVRAVNSWGQDWGPDNGRFWVTFGDLDRLIKTDGEATVATEIKFQGQVLAAVEVGESDTRFA